MDRLWALQPKPGTPPPLRRIPIPTKLVLGISSHPKHCKLIWSHESSRSLTRNIAMVFFLLVRTVLKGWSMTCTQKEYVCMIAELLVLLFWTLLHPFYRSAAPRLPPRELKTSASEGNKSMVVANILNYQLGVAGSTVFSLLSLTMASTPPRLSRTPTWVVNYLNRI